MWMRFVQWTVDIYRDSALNAAVLMDTVEKDARVRRSSYHDVKGTIRWARITSSILISSDGEIMIHF